ncbi:hypothetical protein EIN_398050 [Entamoeba invadens IP1]|uniref:Uncharacterized protein n=1 Tax=Entamoeba invadens IP1 TaxID=370355 RepID=A0A0A1UA67_ENTIV|nr:hypothetical protein EIN_398050 [Entamoeba invadens IP1]ELP91875.1 hypothetical protein EIN_398050 [Entamoeba invadens IP1]|eukprot:XP_004258646.1 hypothetical protein EIN_398050 [Entamoeba invadens IP1]
MQKSVECLCGNISISFREPPPTFIVSVKDPFEWEDPHPITSFSVDMTYFQMVSIRQTATCLIYKCLNCGDDCCCVKGNEGVLNKELFNNENRRKDMKYSETFKVYTLDKESESKDKNAQVIDKLDEQLERILMNKKQEKIDVLFKEKERKIREFVNSQEELFEAQRSIVNSEYETVRNDFKEIHKTTTAQPQQPEKLKRVKTWEAPIKIRVNTSKEVFEFDEEQNEEISGNEIAKSETKVDVPIVQRGVVQFHDVAPCCSVPMRLPSTEIEEESFEEFATSKNINTQFNK